MAYTAADDLYKLIVKGFVSGTELAAKNLDLIDDIFKNAEARKQIVEFLKHGNGNIDDLLKRSDLDKNITKALKQADGFGDILKKSSNLIGQHGSTLDLVGRNLQKGTFKNADELQTFLKNSGMKEGDDLFKAISKQSDELVKNSKLLNASTTANQYLKNAVQAGKGVAHFPGKVYNGIKKGFTSPHYQRKASSGMENLSRSQVEGFKKSGNFAEMVKNGEIIEVRQFSKLRTGVTVGSLLGANSLTDGAVTDGAVALVTSTKSPVAWIVRTVGDGASEGFYSIFGDSEPDTSTPDWINAVDGYDPDRDGMILLVSGETDLATPEEYRSRFDELAGREHTDMDSIMSPEVYAQKYPLFLAAKQEFDATQVMNTSNEAEQNREDASVSRNFNTGASLITAGGLTALAGDKLKNTFNTLDAAYEDGSLQLDNWKEKAAFEIAGIFNENSFLGGVLSWLLGDDLANQFRSWAVAAASDDAMDLIQQGNTDFTNKLAASTGMKPQPQGFNA